MKTLLRCSLAVCWMVISTVVVTAGLFPQGERPAVAVDPVDGIVDAFRSHALVALGEGVHGNEQGHAFRLALLRAARITSVVNDIVVEFGNSRHQDVMDRFVRGEDVDAAVLRRVWQDTTQPQPAWDAPIYEAFFRAVRTTNASLPADRKLRVLLGDPPVDWDAVHSVADLRQWAGRGRHAAQIIQREVLDKGRRALILYGDGHLFRVPATDTIVSLLERGNATRVFTIASPISSPTASHLETLQADVLSWPAPSIVVLRKTVLGAADFTFYYPAPKVIRNGQVVVAPMPDQWRSLRMEDQFDALLYLGRPSSITFSEMPSALCADADYMKMRLQRMALAALPAQNERMKEYCAKALINK